MALSSITESVSSVVYPQLLQLINVYLVKYIDTGDRVTDGIYTTVFNALIAICLTSACTAITYICNILFNYYKALYPSEEEKAGTIIVGDILPLYKIDNIMKYKYNISTETLGNGYNFSNVSAWAIETKKIDSVQVMGQSTPCVVKYPNSSPFNEDRHESLFLNMSRDSKMKNVHVPLVKYVNKNGTDEYVWLCEKTLYSNDIKVLEKLIAEFLKFSEPVQTITTPTTTKRKCRIHELSEYKNGSGDNRDGLSAKGYVSLKITFDKIYFMDKTILLNWLHKFSTNSMYPPNLCLQNKLGILLYGPQGTGKTGCISAMANLLQRDLVLVNSLATAGLYAKDNLETAFKKTGSSSIIVMDEFDYVITQTTKGDDINRSFQKKLLDAKDEDARKKIFEEMNESKKSTAIDIPFILRLLDGVGDDEGRIIIATTNNPEKINPTFLRPGRFDVKLKLSYCTLNMFISIVQTVYFNIMDELDTDDELNRKVNIALKLNITPLVLINNLVSTSSIEELVDALSTLEKEEYLKTIG